MIAAVVKSFPYSRDGIHVVQTVVGEQIDILDDLAPGLIKEGFIADAAKADDGLSAKPSRRRTVG